MQEDLDAIPWGRLQHALGTAEDVPGYLRDLAFGDDAARRHALDMLYNCICHQGSVDEATAPAVPFLVEMVVDRDLLPHDERVSVLVFLLHIAEDSPSMEGARVDGDLSEELRARSRRLIAGVTAIRHALIERLDALLALLDEESDAIRAAVAGVAAHFPDQASSRAHRFAQLRADSSGAARELYELVGMLVGGLPVSGDLLDRMAAVDETIVEHLWYERECEATLQGQATYVAAALAERAVDDALHD